MRSQTLIRLARYCLVLLLLNTALMPALAPAAALAQDDDAEANKALVMRWIEEAINAQNLDLLDEILAPGYVEHQEADTVVYDTVEDYRAVWADNFTLLPDFQLTVEDQMAVDDKVITRFRTTALDGAMELTGIHIARLEDGLVVETWENYDTLAFSMALGTVAPVDPTPEANKAILQRLADEVYNAQNLDVVEEIFAPGYVEHSPSGDFAPESTEELQASIAEDLAAFPDMQITLEDLVAEGDRVAAYYTLISEATGVNVPGVFIVRFEDSRIVEAWHRPDHLGIQVQLDVIELPPLVVTETVTVASGLNGPQGVLVDDEGSVWVVDSGVGGETEIPVIDPESGEPIIAMFGETARIVRIAPDGTQTEAALLPSVFVGEEASGGNRLAVLDGTLYATLLGWAEAIGIERMPLTAAIVRVGEDGSVMEVANTYDVEAAENPGGFAVDSNPYGLAAGPDGLLWIADAGGNDLLTVDPETGEVTVVAVFDGLPGPMPNPERGDAMELDPVPTGVAFDEEGTAYVSLLSGFPFPPGAAKVVTVDAEGNVADYATGLTMLTDLCTGPDGELYAVQIAEFGEEGPVFNSGKILRIQPGEASLVVAEGLSFPTSVDFDADGNAYVTVNGVGAPGSGAVVMLEALVDVVGIPLAESTTGASE